MAKAIAPSRALIPARTAVERAQSAELPVYVTLAEVRRAIEQEPRADVQLLLRFLFVTGARISEALGVQVGHIDFHLRLVRLRTAKTRDGHQRSVPIPDDVLGQLAVHINTHALVSESKVFPWKRGHAHTLVKKALVRAGIEHKRAHPHTLRHGTAVHLIRNGAPLNIVQRVLGHRFLSSTSVYLAVTAADVRDFYEKTEW